MYITLGIAQLMGLQNKEENMNKFRNNLLFVLFGIFCGSILWCIDVSAGEISISSENIPLEKVDIAKKEWEKYSNTLIMDTPNEVNDYYLGQGFTVDNFDTANFPIIKRDTEDICYILQIDKDNQLILSQKFGSKINDLSKKKIGSESNPITLYGNEQTVFYTDQQGNNDTLIGKDSKEENFNIDSVNKNDKQSVNLTKTLDNPDSNQISTMADFDHVVLPWKVYEIQTNLPWCQWYTITGVLNNLANRQITTARQFVMASYPNSTEAQLMDSNYISTLNLYDAFNYMRTRYSVSVNLHDGKPSFSAVKNEIKNRRVPLITDLKTGITTRSSDPGSGGVSSGHSIVQIGYTASSNSSNVPFYHYWNPWWEDTIIVSSAAQYMQLGSYQYGIYRHIINFSVPRN